MKEMTGWQMVVQILKAEGVKYIFGLPGDPTCLYDALYDEPAIKPVLVRHEAAGGFMAMAYALLTRQPTVCFASPGPGIANLVPAMLEALAACAPVIAPCTGINSHNDGKGAFQETDQIEISADGSPVSRLNELEYIQGEIFANVYQTDRIARISPQTGQVTAWIDLAGLLSAVAADAADVLNGIAYDPENDRLFVTGKLWPTLFEIKLIPQ